MEFMKNLKMSLELLQTLNPLYQCYLSSKDQQPVCKDQLPVNKDHRPVPTLRMKTLRTTSMEMKNLAQQYKVHEVMPPEGQCSTQTSMF